MRECHRSNKEEDAIPLMRTEHTGLNSTKNVTITSVCSWKQRNIPATEIQIPFNLTELSWGDSEDVVFRAGFRCNGEFLHTPVQKVAELWNGIGQFQELLLGCKV